MQTFITVSISYQNIAINRRLINTNLIIPTQAIVKMVNLIAFHTSCAHVKI